MKYIITKSSVIIGNIGHWDLLQATDEPKENIVSAGRLKLKDGQLETYGKSCTFDINSRPEDAEIIKSLLTD